MYELAHFHMNLNTHKQIAQSTDEFFLKKTSSRTCQYLVQLKVCVAHDKSNFIYVKNFEQLSSASLLIN